MTPTTRTLEPTAPAGPRGRRDLPAAATARAPRPRRLLAAVVALAVMAPAGRAGADVVRTGDEPWHQLVTAEARREAQALFAQAVDKHLLLLRGDAMALYEQAVALWDNPDIRWNLALVLDDLGDYLAAHHQLVAILRWEAAIGADRLADVRARIQALEAVRLARLEVASDEPDAAIELDGQPWFRAPGRHRQLVVPGTHYVRSAKPGYAPATVSVVAMAGEHRRVTLRMAKDELIETRRWSVWTPWSVVAGGLAVAAVSVGLELQARRHRDAATEALAASCDGAPACRPTRLRDHDRAVVDRRLALGVAAAGGTAVAVGLVLAWLNQPRLRRPEAPLSPVELVPQVAPGGAALSAQVRF